MKSVMASIRPQWCCDIANEIKTVEVRRTKPNLETPFKCYIYCTNSRPLIAFADVLKGDWVNECTYITGYGRPEAERIFDIMNGKVIGEFVCDDISENKPYEKDGVIGYWNLIKGSRLTNEDLMVYGNGDTLYGWHISELEIYDESIDIDNFRKANFDCKRKVCSKEVCRHCYGCWDCELIRPPQSWCYVEERKNK